MNRILLVVFVAGFAMFGCTPKKSEGESGDVTQPVANAPAPSGSSDNITPYTPASGAIPNAPVAGGENIGSGSGGFGVGQAAKDKARSLAGSGGSSVDQMGDQ